MLSVRSLSFVSRRQSLLLLIVFAMVGTLVFITSPTSWGQKKGDSESLQGNGGGIKSPAPTFQALTAPDAGSGTFAGTGAGAIPDGLTGTPPQYGTPLVVTFAVSGLTDNVNKVSVDINITHSWVGDVDIVLAAPGGAPNAQVIGHVGVQTAGSFGDSSNYGGVYLFADAGTTGNFWTNALAGACGDTCIVAPGSYPASQRGTTGQTNPPPAVSLNAAFAGLTPAQANGNWTLTFRDGAAADTGSVAGANLHILTPTASGGVVSGRITDMNGSAVAGTVIRLNGNQSRTAITDASGNYGFGEVDTNGFYSVTPSRTNYSFSPGSRSFSLTGNQPNQDFNGVFDGDSANPVDTNEYFVRQQYLDFLGREPDEGGLGYWSSQIGQCGSDASCIQQKRIDVSAAFFMSGEFQQSGSYVYDMYAGLLGRTPGYGEFTPDRAQVIGGSGLDAAKTAFAQNFVQRSEFTSRYPQSMSREEFVDAVIQTMQVRSGMFMTSLRDGFLSDYDSGGRALVARHAAEAPMFVSAEYNKAFVLMEYFGYLKRGEDAGGYGFWLNILNQGSGDNYRGMVCSFLTSTEYQGRFSSVISHGNGECSQ